MADTATALKSYNDIPVLDWDMQNPEASSYNLFKDLRAQTPLVKVPMGMGSMVLALRARLNPCQAMRNSPSTSSGGICMNCTR